MIGSYVKSLRILGELFGQDLDCHFVLQAGGLGTIEFTPGDVIFRL